MQKLFFTTILLTVTGFLLFGQAQKALAYNSSWYYWVYPGNGSTVYTPSPTFSWGSYTSNGYQVAYLKEGGCDWNWNWGVGLAYWDTSFALSRFGISALKGNTAYCWLIYNGPYNNHSSELIQFYTANFNQPPNAPYRWGTDNGYNTWTNASSLQMGLIGTDANSNMNNIYYQINYYNPNNGGWYGYNYNWASNLGYFANYGSVIYTYTTFGFPDGVYSYGGYGYDSAGAWSGFSGYYYNNYRDGTGPGSWTNLTNGGSYYGATNIVVTGRDRWNPYNWGENWNGSWPYRSGSGLNCLYLAIDGVQWNAGWCGVGDNGSRTYSWNPTPGSHHIQTYAVDNAGNGRWWDDKWVNVPAPTPTPIPTSTPTPTPTPTPIPSPTPTPLQQWFQVSGGSGIVAANRTSGTSIYDILPTGKFFSDPSSLGAIIIAAASTSFRIDQTHPNPSERHLVTNYGAITSSYNYTYFKNKYAARDSSPDSSAGPTLPTNLTGKSYYYYSNPLGALTVNAGTYTGTAVIIVEGDLSITGNITLSANSALAFIVKGRSGGGITLNGSVTAIRGFFLTDGRFDDGASTNALVVTGGVVANNFSLRRNLY